MNLTEKRARGLAAETLLENDLFKEALRQVRYAAHRAFEEAGHDERRLQQAAADLRAATRLQRILVLAVKHGAQAAKEIDRERDGGGLVRGIGRFVRSREEFPADMPWSVER